jgi:NADPH:quinone reductase-like Zn-dependent oxidoreductase
MMMKAIRIHAYGGPDVMRLEELPMPVPGAAQAHAAFEQRQISGRALLLP